MSENSALDSIGKKIQTFFLVLIITLLAVIMGVIGFQNPNAEGCNLEGATLAATVYGSTITEGEFNAAFVASGWDRYPTVEQQRLHARELLLDGLIERELLLREARRLGFTAEGDRVMRRVAREQVVLVSGPVDAPRGFPSGPISWRGQFSDREGRFSAERFENFISRGLRRSVDEFVAWQVDETVAQRVRDAVTAPVTVSPQEVWDAYVHDTERATVSYVRFNPTYYRDRVEPTDEALTAWMAEHTEEVDREYERQRHRYTDLEEQLKARHILVRAERTASEEERAAARTEAEALLERVQNGEDFAALAREHSDDPGSGSRGGDLGWVPRGQMVREFEEALFGLTEDGQVTAELVESQFGYHIIKREGRREGDVDPDVAKRELADGLYRRSRAGELAREDAARALAYLREGHTMEELNAQLRNDWEAPPPPPEQPEEAEEPAEGEEEDEEPPEEPPLAPDAPQVRTSDPFGRGERAITEGGFDSSPITQAAFEMDVHSIPDEPVQLGTDWFVYRLDERTEATRAGFTDEVRTRLETSLVIAKRHEVLSAYIGRLRATAEAAGEIRPNPEILEYGPQQEEEGEEGEEESASL